MNKEYIKIASVAHYQDTLLSLMQHNIDFDMSNADIKDAYEEGEKIPEYVYKSFEVKLIPEPTNVYDANAIQVLFNGQLVGYVKKGSCSHVKNLMKDAYFSVSVSDIGVGKYKIIYDGIVDTEEYAHPFIKLCLKTGQADTTVQQPNVVQVKEIKKPSKKLVYIACGLWALFGLICAHFAPLISAIVFIIIGIVLFKNRGKKQ